MRGDQPTSLAHRRACFESRPEFSELKADTHNQNIPNNCYDKKPVARGQARAHYLTRYLGGIRSKQNESSESGQCRRFAVAKPLTNQRPFAGRDK